MYEISPCSRHQFDYRHSGTLITSLHAQATNRPHHNCMTLVAPGQRNMAKSSRNATADVAWSLCSGHCTASAKRWRRPERTTGRVRATFGCCKYGIIKLEAWVRQDTCMIMLCNLDVKQKLQMYLCWCRKGRRGNGVTPNKACALPYWVIYDKLS